MAGFKPGEVRQGGDLADADVPTIVEAGAGAYLRWSERRQPFRAGKEPVVLFALAVAEVEKLSALIRDHADDPELEAVNRELVDVILAAQGLASDGG